MGASQHHAGRGEPAVYGRGVNNGLERGAGLPPGLGGPVELALLEAVAAHQGEHLAGVRLDGDHGSLDLGLALQVEHPGALLGFRGLGHGHPDHVALLEHLAGVGRVGHVLMGLCGIGLAHPPHGLKRNHAVEPAEADHGLVLVHGGHPRFHEAGLVHDVLGVLRPFLKNPGHVGGRERTDGAEPAAPLGRIDQAALDRLLGNGLVLEVARRGHGQAAVVGGVLAVGVDEPAADLFQIIRARLP